VSADTTATIAGHDAHVVPVRDGESDAVMAARRLPRPRPVDETPRMRAGG
jgi:hypothetical protein